MRPLMFSLMMGLVSLGFSCGVAEAQVGAERVAPASRLPRALAPTLPRRADPSVSTALKLSFSGLCDINAGCTSRMGSAQVDVGPCMPGGYCFATVMFRLGAPDIALVQYLCAEFGSCVARATCTGAAGGGVECGGISPGRPIPPSIPSIPSVHLTFGSGGLLLAATVDDGGIAITSGVAATPPGSQTLGTTSSATIGATPSETMGATANEAISETVDGITDTLGNVKDAVSDVLDGR